MIPALPCGTFSDGDTPTGAFYVAAFEEDDTPHHVGEYRIDVVIRALQALKACDCYDYQAGETPDYNSTPAHDIISQIRQFAIMALPGYEAAAWEIA